mmetsp:Transcript_2932/g.3891  ORF Transcript_2932/g.3891 Transcript_2932/m.3891 type:complete len:82 (-) Transcript_2932:87-332(-)
MSRLFLGFAQHRTSNVNMVVKPTAPAGMASISMNDSAERSDFQKTAAVSSGCIVRPRGVKLRNPVETIIDSKATAEDQRAC